MAARSFRRDPRRARDEPRADAVAGWQKTHSPTKQVLTETSPKGDVTTHQYDALDREVVVTDAAGRKVRTE